MPAGMSLQNMILGDNGIFKPGFDKFSIIDMFDPDNPEIEAERVSRFTESMAQFVDGTFFQRPRGAQGHQPAHPTSHQNHKPIFDRCALQPHLGIACMFGVGLVGVGFNLNLNLNLNFNWGGLLPIVVGCNQAMKMWRRK